MGGENSVPMLSNFSADCVHSVLNQMINELHLSRSQNHPGSNVPEFHKLRERLSVRFSSSQYDGDGIYYKKTGEDYEKAVERLKFDKLYTDKLYFTNILIATVADLQSTRSFHNLVSDIKMEKSLNEEEDEFIVEYVTNVSVEKYFKNKIDLYRAGRAQIIEAPDEPLDRFHILNNMKIRFVRNWEKARVNQQTLYYEKMEEKFKEEMRDCTTKLDFEARCQVESEQYMLMKMESMKQDCVAWMEKYDADYDLLETNIHLASAELETFRTKFKNKRDMYEYREKRMNKYLDKKRLEREEIEYLALCEKTATRLQAWWRGVMVRRCLGPYRKKKKRGKGKKGKK